MVARDGGEVDPCPGEQKLPSDWPECDMQPGTPASSLSIFVAPSFPEAAALRFSSDLTLFIAWAVFTTSITSLSPSWLLPHHPLFWKVQNTTEFYLHGLRSDASTSYLGLGIAGIEGFSKDTLPIPLLLSVASAYLVLFLLAISVYYPLPFLAAQTPRPNWRVPFKIFIKSDILLSVWLAQREPLSQT